MQPTASEELYLFLLYQEKLLLVSFRFAAHTLSSALGFPYQLFTVSHFSFIIISFHFLKLYMVFLFFTVVFTSLSSQSHLSF